MLYDLDLSERQQSIQREYSIDTIKYRSNKKAKEKKCPNNRGRPLSIIMIILENFKTVQ